MDVMATDTFDEVVVTETIYVFEDYGSASNETTDFPVVVDQMPHQLRTALLVVVSSIFIIGVFGNLLAIFIFLSSKALRTVPNYLIVNLSFSDLLLLVVNGPMMLASVFHGSWPFGTTGCQIYAFCGSIASFASIGSMAAIAIDRYYVICHCFHALMNVSRNRTLTIIFLVWVYSAIWSIPPFVGIGAYVEEGYGIGCTFDYVTRSLNTTIYIGLIYIGGFIIPVFVIALCYFKIFMTVDKHKKEIGKYSKTKPGKGSASDPARQPHGRRKGGSKFSRLMAHYQLAKVGVIATVVFCISWGPYGAIALYSQFALNMAPIRPLFQVIPVVFAKMSTIWNPFVYAISHKRFKKALFHMVRSAFTMTESRLTRTNTQSQDLPDSTRSNRSHDKGSIAMSSRAASISERRTPSGSVSGSSQMSEVVIGLPPTIKKQPLQRTRSDPCADRGFTNEAMSYKEEGEEDPVTTKTIELETISGSSLVRNVFYRKTWHPGHGSTNFIIANDSKALRTVPNYLIVYLSFVDLLLLVVNGPMMLASVFHGLWPFGTTGCQIYAFCGSIASFASIGSMAAIAIDRYYVICHCFHALMNVSRDRTLIIIFLVWVYSAIWSIPPFVGIGAYVEEGYGIGCTFDYVTRSLNTTIYIGLIYIGGFIIPLFVIALCYFKIFMTVDKHKKEIGKYSKTKPGKGSASDPARQPHGRRKGGSKFSRLMAHYQLAKVGVIATVVFCISWGPYGAIALYSQFALNMAPIRPLFQVIPVVFAKMSTIWNPFVYAISHKRFKKALFHMVRSAFTMTESRLTRTNTQSQDLPDSTRSNRSNDKGSIAMSSRAASISERRTPSGSVSGSSQMSEVVIGLPPTIKKQPLQRTRSDPCADRGFTNEVMSYKEEGEDEPVTSKTIELETISRSSLVRNVFYRKTWHPGHGSTNFIIANEYV